MMPGLNWFAAGFTSLAAIDNASSGNVGWAFVLLGFSMLNAVFAIVAGRRR